MLTFCIAHVITSFNPKVLYIFHARPNLFYKYNLIMNIKAWTILIYDYHLLMVRILKCVLSVTKDFQLSQLFQCNDLCFIFMGKLLNYNFETLNFSIILNIQ